MVDPKEFLSVLQEADVRFFTGVPDSLLKDACGFINDHAPAGSHIIATNEGSAIGLAIGHFLATGRPALIYMQNSGLGNATNPLASLVDRKIYGIPMILMVGWRGEILSNGDQIKDEPQHVMQGRITPRQLELLEIPYRILEKETSEITTILHDLVEQAISSSGPVALVVRKGAFAPYSTKRPPEKGDLISREEAISAVLEVLPDGVPIVSTTGMASRELFEMRKREEKGHHRDFLTVGGMGHASQIASGIALARRDLSVVCLDGDGALLMHMGGLAISSACPNLVHIVLNNGVHDSVGGQPTKARQMELGTIARACGYKMTGIGENRKEIQEMVGRMLESHTPSFLEIRCRPGHRGDLGRPDRTPAQNKADFMHFIQGKTRGKK